MLLALVREGDGWSEVLASPSPVDGIETLAVASDLNRDGRLDLVTWGSDEGGYIPRVFRSQESGYAPVPVPEAYILRFKEGWSSACRVKVCRLWSTPRVCG